MARQPEGHRLLFFVESVIGERPLDRPVLGFRLSELPPLFIAAPSPPPGLERSRSSAPGATVPFGVGREASFRSAEPLPPYLTLQLRLVDEADGRLVGSGALRLPTRAGAPEAGGGAGGSDPLPSAPAPSAADEHVGQFVELRLSRAPAELSSAQRHAQRQRAELDAAAATAAAARLDAKGAAPARPARGADEGESALVRFRWRLAPDELSGFAPEPSALRLEQPPRQQPPPARELAARGADAPEAAAVVTAAEAEQATRAAAAEPRVPAVHVRAREVVLHGGGGGGAARAPAARVGGGSSAPPRAEPPLRPHSAAPPARPPAMDGLVPGVGRLRAGGGALGPAGLVVDAAADRSWLSATGSDGYGAPRESAGSRARGSVGTGQPAPVGFHRLARRPDALPSGWWEEGEDMRPLGAQYAPPQPPPLCFSAPAAPRAPGRGDWAPGGAPAPFDRAVHAAAAEGGFGLRAASQDQADAEARGAEPDGTAARPLWWPTGAETALAADAPGMVAPAASPPPWALAQPPLATSRAALAQLRLDLQFMGSREYAAQLLRHKILSEHPHIARAPRPGGALSACAAAARPAEGAARPRARGAQTPPGRSPQPPPASGSRAGSLRGSADFGGTRRWASEAAARGGAAHAAAAAKAAERRALVDELCRSPAPLPRAPLARLYAGPPPA